MNSISNHTGQIYDVQFLCNILVVKISKIIRFATLPSLENMFCDVIDIMCYLKSHFMCFFVSHICSSLFRITDRSKRF